MRASPTVCVLLVLASCGDDRPPPATPERDARPGDVLDSSADLGVSEDAGPPRPDAALVDAGVFVDAGMFVDAGTLEAGGRDASLSDAGERDGGGLLIPRCEGADAPDPLDRAEIGDGSFRLASPLRRSDSYRVVSRADEIGLLFVWPILSELLGSALYFVRLDSDGQPLTTPVRLAQDDSHVISQIALTAGEGEWGVAWVAPMTSDCTSRLCRVQFVRLGVDGCPISTPVDLVARWETFPSHPSRVALGYSPDAGYGAVITWSGGTRFQWLGSDASFLDLPVRIAVGGTPIAVAGMPGGDFFVAGDSSVTPFSSLDIETQVVHATRSTADESMDPPSTLSAASAGFDGRASYVIGNRAPVDRRDQTIIYRGTSLDVVTVLTQSPSVDYPRAHYTSAAVRDGRMVVLEALAIDRETTTLRLHTGPVPDDPAAPFEPFGEPRELLAEVSPSGRMQVMFGDADHVVAFWPHGTEPELELRTLSIALDP